MTLEDMRPRWRPDITVGNVLTIMAIAAGGLAVVVRLEEQQRMTGAQIADLRVATASNAAEIKATETRLRGVEQTAVRADERYGSILTLLGTIDARLQRIETRSPN